MLVIVSVMVGCSKTNNSLKERKCAQLDKIYEELDYKEYSLSNWNLIINYIEECKLKIKLYNEKNQINKIYNETMNLPKNIGHIFIEFYRK